MPRGASQPLLKLFGSSACQDNKKPESTTWRNPKEAMLQRIDPKFLANSRRIRNEDGFFPSLRRKAVIDWEEDKNMAKDNNRSCSKKKKEARKFSSPILEFSLFTYETNATTAIEKYILNRFLLDWELFTNVFAEEVVCIVKKGIQEIAKGAVAIDSGGRIGTGIYKAVCRDFPKGNFVSGSLCCVSILCEVVSGVLVWCPIPRKVKTITALKATSMGCQKFRDNLVAD